MQAARIIGLIIFCIYTQSSWAQYRSQYVENYKDLLSLRLVGIAKINRITLRAQEKQSLLEYLPNQRYNFGAGFNYKWLGLNAVFSLPFINNDNARYGETTQLDVQGRVLSKHFISNFHLQRYKGFYISNPGIIFNDWTQNQIFPQRPDMKLLSFGASFAYSFNEKFSYQAAFVQNERQKRSAGTFNVGPYFSLLRIKGDSSLVPMEMQNVFHPSAHISYSHFADFGVKGGYIYTYVPKKYFFMTFSMELGVAVQHSEFEYVGRATSRERWAFSSRLKMQGVIGYNHPKFYSGFSVLADNFLFNRTGTHQLAYGLGYVRLYLGYRIDVRRKPYYSRF